MREKYVGEKVGVWIIFGEYPDGDVDVSDQNRDVFVKVPRPVAEKVIALHDEFRQKLYEVLKTGGY